MLELRNKLDTGFRKIEPNISITKAFELLGEPGIRNLIIVDEDSNTFYYLTTREINRCIKAKKDMSGKSLKEIAVKSLIFDLDQYNERNIEYLVEFRRNVLGFAQPKPDMFLVKHNGEPVGLVSEVVFKNIPDSKPEEFISELDLFLENNSEPFNNLDKFYEILSNAGFQVTGEVKSYITKLVQAQLHERENNLKLTIHTTPKPELDIIGDLPAPKQPEVDSLKTPGSSTTRDLVVIYNPNHITHRPTVTSPEIPERMIKIVELLKSRGNVFNSHCKLISDYPPATEEDLLMVHDKEYVKFIKTYASRGGGFLGDSTYVTSTTHELALAAVGGALKAAEEVLAGHARFGLALIRPPGHHASRDKYGGYCIYNNAAILARYLQKKHGKAKILILDWDAHAANGTMNIFYDDPTVMLISLHQDPHNYYPKTGFISQMGSSKGLGYTINMEMPRGSSDKEYMTVFYELVIPLFNKFAPDFVIGCNGFDAHHSDQYTDLNLTADGYYKFSTIFRKYMIDKMVILMEGGYNPHLGELTHTLINGLSGLPNQFKDSHLSLIQQMVGDEKIQVVFNEKLKELKFNLKRFHLI